MIARNLSLVLWLLLIAAPSMAAPQVDWDQKIDIDLKSADLIQTLSSFATVGGGEVIADPKVSGSVTANFKDEAWSGILDSICKEHDLACYWMPGAPPALRVGPSDVGFSGLAESISLELLGASLDQVLAAFQAISGEALDLAPALPGAVDIKLNSVPWPVALDHICQVSGCAVDWDATPPKVTSTPTRRVDELPLDPFLSTGAALERLAASPALGPMAPLEVVIDGNLPAALSSRIDGGSWTRTLDTVCKDLDCTWRLIYGEPSRLLLRPRDERVEQKLPFEKGDIEASALAATLARMAGVQLAVADGFKLDGSVKIARNQPPWESMADTLCADLGCAWSLDAKTLEIVPLSRPIATRPTRRSAPVALDVRFENVEKRTGSISKTAVATTAHFTWAKPVAHFAAGDQKWLHLTWIPFDEPVVLPLVAHCGNGTVDWLEPVGLPLGEAFDRGVGDLIVELRPPQPPRAPRAPRPPAAPEPAAPPAPPSPEEAPPAPPHLENAPLPEAPPAPPVAPAGPPADCIESGQVIVRIEEVGGRSTRTQLQLGPSVGDYLLITPPAGGARPAAAVVRLGQQDGAPRVALLRPAQGAGPTVEARGLLGAPLIADLAYGGRNFRLEVSVPH